MLIQPSLAKTMYCGTSSTCPGSIMVPSIRAKKSLRPVKFNRAKPYAASEQESRFPTMLSTTITNELAR
ncbi:hypothetical protein [Plantactinospora mayteni]|uniref:hypothetical protein n=1 Tax=Plantactinospora mayteni TaxID=566021 RepID=UPI0027DE55EE|nr:hypothetical protein [Plantactinospora mayteni]